MGAKENFESLQVTYLAIKNENVKEPNLPVHIAIDEALDLQVIALQDEDALGTTDLDLNLIRDITPRAEGLRHAQALWTQVFQVKSDAEEQWKAISPEAYELRDELLHYCKYAYRNDDKLMAVVDNIASGSGNSDMVQDLTELAILGKENPTQLEAVSFDLTKLDRAAELSDTCGQLMSQVNGARTANDKPAKDMRDRAFTHLKIAVDAIRAAGKFAFWKEPERMDLYASEYSRKLYNRKKKKEEETV